MRGVDGRRTVVEPHREPSPRVRRRAGEVSGEVPGEVSDEVVAGQVGSVVAREVDPAPGLGSILAGALRQLAQATGASRAEAWRLLPNGAAGIIATAFPELPAPETDDPDAAVALPILWSLGRPIDLGGTEVDERVGAFARRVGLSAGVSLVSAAGQPLAALLLAGPDDAPGRVRPRTLAALEQIAQRLRDPMRTAAAIARLEALGDDARRLDRLAALGALLTEVAHEVRNPLVSVKTFLQLLPDRLEDPEFLDGFRELVGDEVARLERLLDDLVQQARRAGGRTGRRTTCDVRPGLDSLTRLLAHRARERRIEIVTQIDDALPEVAIDYDEMRQIVLNLTLNALDAAPDGSRVTLGASQRNDAVRVTVDDEGPGVPDSLREQLFEPFFTTREGGAGGLGLAIARRLAEQAGGSLRVADAPSGGARMELRLPCGPGGGADSLAGGR